MNIHLLMSNSQTKIKCLWVKYVLGSTQNNFNPHWRQGLKWVLKRALNTFLSKETVLLLLSLLRARKQEQCKQSCKGTSRLKPKSPF